MGLSIRISTDASAFSPDQFGKQERGFRPESPPHLSDILAQRPGLSHVQARRQPPVIGLAALLQMSRHRHFPRRGVSIQPGLRFGSSEDAHAGRERG